jgi:CheY-like chemotaxis protein
MGNTVLVVDDESTTRRLVHYVLKPLGVETLDAGNGAEAMAAVQDRRVDLILMDINLPGGDGFELTVRLRAMDHLKDVPVIIFTARSHPTDAKRAAESGAVGFLYKPFSTSELRQVVSQHLGLK